MMTGYYSIRDFDWTLLGLAAIISTLGLLEIYSATRSTIWQDAHLKQMAWLAAGVVLFWLISVVDYNWLVEHVPALYVGVVVLLVAVKLFAPEINGSQRWLPLPGGVSFQVSEFVKVVLVLLVARYFGDRSEQHLDWAGLLKIFALFAVPVGLVVIQPDLSTALSFLPILAVSVLFAGMRWKQVAVLAVLTLLVLPLGWRSLKPYQKARVLAFADTSHDPQGAGYQQTQSKIAVGAGGIWGQGLSHGSQTQLRFIPVPHTDFIFSAFAEETGFSGVVLALSLYFILLMKIVNNAQTAADPAGKFICVSVAGLILFHILVNIGMVIGRMPVTGLPLPLMSYGGSHVFSTLMLIGLVNNVRLRRFTN
jgi:rod shape determining protein RodA